MKDIPIIINNRDRLKAPIELVTSLSNRGYTNIVIIDNGSTYQPLLDWYKTQSMANVFYNTFVEQSLMTLEKLLHEYKHEYFVNLLTDKWFVYTDSDINLIPETPDNFIELMVEMCEKHNKHKVGLGIMTDDITQDKYSDPEYWELMKFMRDYENQFWEKLVDEHECCNLYDAPIDTTFAVYRPNSRACGSADALRTGYPFILRHMPFYYDLASFPEDEKYYLTHKIPGAITGFSDKVLKFIN